MASNLIQRFAQFLVGAAAAGGLTLLGALGTNMAARFLPLIGRLRRLRFSNEPIPDAWLPILRQRIPLVARLTPERTERLLRLIQVFLRDVPIDGCNGLELTDEIRLTIAGQACLLLVGLPYPWYPKLRRVLVHPRVYASPHPGLLKTGELPKEARAVAGEAWHHGTVVLSWDNVRVGCENPFDGHNVVVHEFAHLLDVEDGAFDGVPVLEPPSSYPVWALVMQLHYGVLGRKVTRGKKRRGLLRSYGATNRAEFFAVATEAFFEKPKFLRDRAPDLYKELAQYYRQDPAAGSSQSLDEQAPSGESSRSPL